MQIESTSLFDVKIITPDIFPDDRGQVFEAYNQTTFTALGINDAFLQDTVSISKQGVLRGLHFQTDPFAQAKLVSVIKGEVFDVAVDLRSDSPDFGKWVGVTLNDQNHRMLYVPKGFAHGFYVLSEEARFFYKMSGANYNKSAASGVIWNDPEINVAWPLIPGKAPILSAQDQGLKPFSAFKK
jgi:dTDP-4-dehydrorhamnose 3,5-epimerase